MVTDDILVMFCMWANVTCICVCFVFFVMFYVFAAGHIVSSVKKMVESSVEH